MSVQYMGVTVQWRISWVHQVNIMSTLGDTLSSDTTAVCPFIITDKGIDLNRISFKLASIFIHCVFCDASSLMDTYM